MHYLETEYDAADRAHRQNSATYHTQIWNDQVRSFTLAVPARQVRWAELDGQMYLADEVTLESHYRILRQMIADRNLQPRLAGPDPLRQATTYYLGRPEWSDLRRCCRIIRAIKKVLAQ
jgi:hypothetical protein